MFLSIPAQSFFPLPRKEIFLTSLLLSFPSLMILVKVMILIGNHSPLRLPASTFQRERTPLVHRLTYPNGSDALHNLGKM
ncbi:hypothetical protein P280DRAFT_42144 [Massarina eburnea CBS 473.64]|uniref:Uncharacterized protein n=1 Tax=Massarina eburnea CBS 473.64 TaxID=1395130 RepID=A0A6A6RYU6_9PLEO|nr:hypothetical protein P280DRAFT_42144 [Massarina eburnea CBS 473.64]